jgi:cell division protein FtsL
MSISRSRATARRSSARARAHGWKRRSIWIGAGLATAMMAAVWERSEVVSLGYEVGQLRSLRDLELQRHRALVLESASLSSLERVDQLASAQLGLVPATPGQIQLVPERSSVDPSALMSAMGARAQVAKAREQP